MNRGYLNHVIHTLWRMGDGKARVSCRCGWSSKMAASLENAERQFSDHVRERSPK